ncbi:hypothetical protein [Helicobacter ailurogastricus]|uniref:Putative n=1 Tax=Helicobacter ailurogastricus TaxID=1578720 RepID=A0A0K2Y0R9_9HELI|nr:hypothetical protein [Helicobacter ailurogastricus]CRF40467.1 hypothetical protein HAL011_02240 [Helicobacter ailurogastricus]CRF43440.1 hypothetical protein HAL013_16770 [Helicobacter ailurogastricus]CRF43993.1 hypothetical protein HAL09_05570 [Helicobacter ailurogastricus]CRF52518.1 putative [Helicobacter ailurogastricus]
MQCVGVFVASLLLNGGFLLAEDALDTSLIHHNHQTPQHRPTQPKAPTPHATLQHTKRVFLQNDTHTSKRATHTYLHPWIYSTMFLTAYFGDGHYKQGYGLLLPRGHVLTSSELAYDKGMYATTFMAKMQDDSAPVLICVARLRIKAIDRNRGLALLNTHAFTNDFCQTRPESFYHARIYKKYAQNLLHAKNSPTLPGSPLYYPTVSDTNAFVVENARQTLEHLLPKGNEVMDGQPFFNSAGVFLGMAVNSTKNPRTFVPSGTIYDFLRDLRHRHLF